MLRIAVSRWNGAPGPRVASEAEWAIEIAAGEISALEGPNGSGKSVLLSAIAGLEPCGQITTQWTPTPRIPPVLAAQYPELQTFAERVREEVVFGAVRRGLSVDRALALARGHLEPLGLGGHDFLSRRCWDLSTGERRLVQVVGALVSPASLVLLDEPTAGIDPARRRALASLVVGRLGLSPVLVASQDASWLDWVGARRWRIGRSRPKSPSPSQKTD